MILACKIGSILLNYLPGDVSCLEPLDTLEDWFGEFSDSQKARIREIRGSITDRGEYWLAFRKERHQMLLTLLRSGPNQTGIEQHLRDRFVTRRSLREEELAAIATAREQWRTALLAVDALLTEDQRKHAIAELHRYRDDFLALSKESPTDRAITRGGDS